MPRFSDEQKSMELEKIVEFGKSNHFFTMKKLLDSYHSQIGESALSSYTKKMYNETLNQYLLRNHAIMNEEECQEYANVLYKQVIEYSQGKPKIETLTLDNVSFGDVDMQILRRFWVDQDEPERMTLARKLALDGVLKMPFETEEEKKLLIKQVLDLTKKKIIDRMRFEKYNLDWITYYHEKFVFLEDVLCCLVFPECDFFGYYTVEFTEPYVGKKKVNIYHESVLQWIKDIYMIDLRTFFEKSEILCTKEELYPYFRQQIEAWKAITKEKGKQKDFEGLSIIADKLKDEAEKLKERKKVPKDPRPALKIALENNIPSFRWMKQYLKENVINVEDEDAANNYLKQLFIQEDILLNKEEVEEADRISALKHDIYEDIDRYNIEEVLKKIGIAFVVKTDEDGEEVGIQLEGFPKDRSFDVVLNDKTFTVQYKLKRKASALVNDWAFDYQWRYDAYEAISTMRTAEEIREELINGPSDAWVYAKPEFKDDPKELSKDAISQRLYFLVAIAALLETDEIAREIVEYAPKKKNGTFHKNRVIRLADSLLAERFSTTLGISGRTKSDNLIIVSFDELTEEPGELDTIREDFLNSHQKIFEFEKWIKDLKDENAIKEFSIEDNSGMENDSLRVEEAVNDKDSSLSTEDITKASIEDHVIESSGKDICASVGVSREVFDKNYLYDEREETDNEARVRVFYSQEENETEEKLYGIFIQKYIGDDLIVTVPEEVDGVKVLRIDNFGQCSGIEELIVPDRVRYKEDAFDGCQKLVSKGIIIAGRLLSYPADSAIIEIPSGVKSISGRVFRGNKQITEVVLPEGVATIENGAYEGCENLKKINFPNSLIEIGAYAFQNCVTLENLCFPNGLEKIGASAFKGCSSLKGIEIHPATYCDSAAFSTGTNNLSREDGYTIVNGVMYNVDYRIFRNHDKWIVDIPSDVTAIDGDIIFNSPGSVIDIFTITDKVEFINTDDFFVSSIEDFRIINHIDGKVLFETDCLSSKRNDSYDLIMSSEDFETISDLIAEHDFDELNDLFGMNTYEDS